MKVVVSFTLLIQCLSSSFLILHHFLRWSLWRGRVWAWRTFLLFLPAVTGMHTQPAADPTNLNTCQRFNQPLPETDHCWVIINTRSVCSSRKYNILPEVSLGACCHDCVWEKHRNTSFTECLETIFSMEQGRLVNKSASWGGSSPDGELRRSVSAFYILCCTLVGNYWGRGRINV